MSLDDGFYGAHLNPCNLKKELRSFILDIYTDYGDGSNHLYKENLRWLACDSKAILEFLDEKNAGMDELLLQILGAIDKTETDCSKCRALCCIHLDIDSGKSGRNDEACVYAPAGVVCKNLCVSSKSCSIYTQRPKLCREYDCFGAGPLTASYVSIIQNVAKSGQINACDGLFMSNEPGDITEQDKRRHSLENFLFTYLSNGSPHISFALRVLMGVSKHDGIELTKLIHQYYLHRAFLALNFYKVLEDNLNNQGARDDNTAVDIKNLMFKLNNSISGVRAPLFDILKSARRVSRQASELVRDKK